MDYLQAEQLGKVLWQIEEKLGGKVGACEVR